MKGLHILSQLGYVGFVGSLFKLTVSQSCVGSLCTTVYNKHRLLLAHSNTPKVFQSRTCLILKKTLAQSLRILKPVVRLFLH